VAVKKGFSQRWQQRVRWMQGKKDDHAAATAHGRSEGRLTEQMRTPKTEGRKIRDWTNIGKSVHGSLKERESPIARPKDPKMTLAPKPLFSEAHSHIEYRVDTFSRGSHHLASTRETRKAAATRQHRRRRHHYHTPKQAIRPSPSRWTHPLIIILICPSKALRYKL
jgi:hypothetical protein